MDWLGNILTIESLQLGALVTGIVLAGVGYLRTWLEDRKRYTLNMLMGYSQGTELLRMLHHVREQAARVKAGEKCKVDAAMAERLAVVLPHFQSIALASQTGLLNRGILISARYGTMQTIWNCYQEYVEEQREQLDRPLLYKELEEFLSENAGRYSRYQKQFDRG